jgi:crotonobetainyl-CoA:carnitine CoA-transferase CaiB-like acyl-CoA transferase
VNRTDHPPGSGGLAAEGLGLHDGDADHALPLAGVRVVDITTSYSGPVMTMYLGDLGADVVKVERPTGGDDCRSWGPPFISGRSAWFLSANRNKRSVALDLSDPSGHEALLRLLASADVFVENLNPAKLARLSAGPEELLDQFPRLIYCSLLSGFGLSGPDAERPGYDLITQARSGLMSVTGEVGGAPQRVSTALSDVVAGLVAAFVTCAALREQSLTNRGRLIDVSLLEATLALMGPRIASFLAGEPEPRPSGATDSVLSVYQTFPTADRDIVVAVGNDAMWKRLCTAIGIPELATRDELATNEGRRRHRAEVIETIRRRLADRPSRHWLSTLAEAAVPVALVSTLSEVVDDEQLKARHAFTTIDVPGSGPVTVVDSPWRLGPAGSRRRHRPPPVLGADTVEVLRELAYEPEEIRVLIEKGVAWSPADPVR